MKRVTTALLILLLTALTVMAQKPDWKSVFGATAGVSIAADEFAVKSFGYDAGFATLGPNIEAEYLYYGRFFGFSSSIGYASIFYNEKAYKDEYDRVLDGYGLNEVNAGNYQILKFLVGFTLKIPEFNHFEVMLLFHLGYARSIHPNLIVSNSELGVINSFSRVSDGSPMSNTGLRINYWLDERYGINLNCGINLTRPSFYDETGIGGSYSLPIHYANVNVGFVMKLNADSL